MDAAGFNADLDVAVAELELFVARGDFALSVEIVGQAVEDRGVFVDDWVEGGDRVEDAFDDDVAFAGKVVELAGGERGHGFPPMGVRLVGDACVVSTITRAIRKRQARIGWRSAIQYTMTPRRS